MSDDGSCDFGMSIEGVGGWMSFGDGSAGETAKWKSTLQSLRRRNAWRQDEELADRLAALSEENERLRQCISGLIELLTQKGVAAENELRCLLETIQPPQAESESNVGDTSDDLATLARLVQR